MHDLLNSQREKAIANFDLTSEEHHMISEIKADSIEQFACQLDDWLLRRQQEMVQLAPMPTFRYRHEPSLLS